MLLRARNWPLLAVVLATPALAQQRMVSVDVRAAPLADAVRSLSRQTGASIGFQQTSLRSVRVRAVRGRMTAAQALERMLADTGLRARYVAAETFLVETAPAPARVVKRPPARTPVVTPPPATPSSEVVVTATKRAVPLSAYPGGVQIVGGESLSAADAGHGSDLLEMRVASVASTHLGPGRNKLFIRGIADSSFVGPTQATVGQYWGNSRITYSAPDPSLRLYDVQRIEVLEGPQGTLYGAGSLGGVVRVVPHAPDLGRFEGQAWGGVQAVQHGSTGADGGLILNLPVASDSVALRGLVFGSTDAGYIDDRGRGLHDINRVHTIGARMALRVDPGDDWTIDINGVGQTIHGDDGQYADRDGDGLTRSSAVAQPYRNNYALAEMVAHKAWGSLDFTGSVGYANQYVTERFEGEAIGDPEVAPMVGAPPAVFEQTSRIDMMTFEGRLARRGSDGTGWLVGASLLDNTARVNRQMDVAALGGLDMPLTGVRNKVDEATLYGELTVEPLRRVTVTLGGRVNRARLSGQATDVPRMIALRVNPDAEASRIETRFLPSVAVAWRPAAALTLFARYQQGFRPGGIAIRRDFIEQFKGDRVGTLESGLRWSSHRLDASIGLAWTRWKDIQADLIDGFGFPTTSNIGDGRILSISSAAKWRPVNGLELEGALYINDSRVTRTAPLVFALEGPALDASRLPNVANLSGRLGLTYERSLGDGAKLDVTGFARYVGKSTLGIGAVLGQVQGDYLDTGLEIRIGTPRRGISLALTNLLDSRGNRFALGSPFEIRDHNQITPLQPRSIRLGFDVSF
jgi:outer membrane receptor protein involved in Fe transport